MEALSSRIEIGVPGTDHVNHVTDTNEYVTKAFKLFCKWFGGANVRIETGGYTTSTGQCVVEPINWVWSCCTTQQLEMFSVQVISMARTICIDLHQECVAVIINTTMFFVTG